MADNEILTAQKVSKYGVFSDPYFLVGIRTEYGINIQTEYTVRIQENTAQKKLRIWTLSRSDYLRNIKN